MQFVDLAAQRARLEGRVEKAVQDVVSSGQYILGPWVADFEQQLADYVGVKHCVGCASGTDALQIPLMAWNIGPGDAVFCPAFTFAATAEVVALVGAEPVFVDVDADTYNMDPASLQAAIDMILAEGRLIPKAIIPVDLFGLSADYSAIQPIATRHGLKIVEDAAQSVGGRNGNTRLGAFGECAATSFYPAKPLGCYGDGGAMFTNNDELAELMRSINFHGKGTGQYDNVRIGLTSRLDTMQAAILIEKLSILDEEMDARQQAAQIYSDGLKDVAKVPQIAAGQRSAWAQYAIELKNRDQVRQALADQGIPSVIYYVKPLHKQVAYQNYPIAPDGLPVSEGLPEHILCLPMHPYLDAADQQRIIDVICQSAA